MNNKLFPILEKWLNLKHDADGLNIKTGFKTFQNPNYSSLITTFLLKLKLEFYLNL